MHLNIKLKNVMFKILKSKLFANYMFPVYFNEIYYQIFSTVIWVSLYGQTMKPYMKQSVVMFGSCLNNFHEVSDFFRPQIPWKLKFKISNILMKTDIMCICC